MSSTAAPSSSRPSPLGVLVNVVNLSNVPATTVGVTAPLATAGRRCSVAVVADRLQPFGLGLGVVRCFQLHNEGRSFGRRAAMKTP